MVMVVPIEEVSLRDGERIPSDWEIKKVKSYLEKQGLIEPLVADDQKRIGYQAWDAARLFAAKELGWDTVIIAILSEKERRRGT